MYTALVGLTVEIPAIAVVSDADSITADIKRLVMQRLMDVANKVNDESHRIEQVRRARASSLAAAR
jgi:hypothetical protein